MLPFSRDLRKLRSVIGIPCGLVPPRDVPDYMPPRRSTVQDSPAGDAPNEPRSGLKTRGSGSASPANQHRPLSPSSPKPGTVKGAVDAFQAAEREQAVQLNVMEEYARRTKASPSNIAAARANVTPPMSPAADATKTKLTKGQRRKALRKKAKMRQQQTEGLAAEAAHDVQSHEVTAAPITEVTECHDEEHAGQEAHDEEPEQELEQKKEDADVGATVQQEESQQAGKLSVRAGADASPICLSPETFQARRSTSLHEQKAQLVAAMEQAIADHTTTAEEEQHKELAALRAALIAEGEASLAVQKRAHEQELAKHRKQLTEELTEEHDQVLADWYSQHMGDKLLLEEESHMRILKSTAHKMQQRSVHKVMNAWCVHHSTSASLPQCACVCVCVCVCV